MPVPEQNIGPSHPEENPLQPVEAAAPVLGASSLGETVNVEWSAAPESTVPTPEEIPDIPLNMSIIKRQMHLYTYNEQATVDVQERAARAMDPSERSQGQEMLLGDVGTLKELAPYSYGYKDLYTPEELRELVGMLTLLREKNRVDFADVEGRIADLILSKPNLANQYDSGIAAIVKRAHESGRARMSWKSVSRAAKVATIFLHDGLKRVSGYQYIISIETKDTIDGKTEMNPIYQFAASMFAQEKVAERKDQLLEKRREVFVSNAALLNEWYASTKPAIDRLPDSVQGDRHAAAWELSELMSTMNERLNGLETSGRMKSFLHDSSGALNLQLKVRYLAKSIRTQLDEYISPDELEITPLDP